VYDDDKSLALDSVRHGSVRCMNGDAKRIIADGYDRMGRGFAEWNATRPSDGRRWFLDEVVARLPEGSTVLELGCGPGTDASELSAGRRYVGMDVSPGQLSIARDRVPSGMFVVGDLASIAFRSGSFDGIVAFYVFNHVPLREVQPAFAAAFAWLRPGGYLMLAALPTMEDDDRVEEWLDVPMFFAGIEPQLHERALRQVGFELELCEGRFPTEEAWGLNEPLWVIARKPQL
jgi:cyclopropane fatty-acyl-phospholipid synthase-like methyltransferase